MDPRLENEQKPVVLEADTVYLLMKRGFPISRNVRAQWLLQHLDTVISIQNPDTDYDQMPDLEIVSVLPKNMATIDDCAWCPESGHNFLYKVSSSTTIKFLAHKYRMVFSLDLSPSLATVDIQNGEIVIDEVLMATKKCLEGLTKPLAVPGSRRVVYPEIYVTVIVHTPFFINPAQQVLVQGWLVSMGNVADLMQVIELQLNSLEENVARVTGLVNLQLETWRAESDRLVGGLFEESGMGMSKSNNATNNSSDVSSGVAMVSPETGFVNMLRYGMLALSLLPEYSCAHLVVVTDGIVGPTSDVHALDSIIQQLRATTIACSFLHVGSSYHPSSANGLVPYPDLLRFIAGATSGTYMTVFSTFLNNSGANAYHENLLCWQLYRSDESRSQVEDEKEEESETLTSSANVWRTRNSLFHGHEAPQLLRKKQVDAQVTCTLNSLLCCRLREGYLIKRAAIREGVGLEICFVLPWKTHVYIEYSVTCPRFSKSLSVCSCLQYAITIEAPYEFLHDITCLSKKPLKSRYRQSVVSRFWSVLTSLTEADHMLAHFSWFPGSLGWTWYSVPDTIRSGMPLFYTPSGNSSVQLSDAACPQFGQIWQPVVSLEPHQWSRWLHSQRITLLLLHDRPLSKHLHQVNQSGRFQCVQYRQSAAVLYGMLKSWATFVLVENHTYVQFISSSSSNEPPISFSLVNVSCKPSLCLVVLNVAFAGGTEGLIRHQVMVDLLGRLSQLTLPSRGEQQAGAHSCCAILMHKALEKILIRYERMPADLGTLVFPDGSAAHAATAQIAAARSQQKQQAHACPTLSRYLYHTRWLWLLKGSPINAPRLTVAAVARILATIVKIRLAEGFNFAYSSTGIINTVTEVQMAQPGDGHNTYPCVVQYILFPPHVVVAGRSGSEEETEQQEEEEGETDEDGENGIEDGDFQIVMEAWIEPQCGRVAKTVTSKAGYMHGLEYNQLSNAISRIDQDCVNALLTLEHLSLMCQASPLDGEPIGQGVKGSRRGTDPQADDRIRSMQFDFDPLGILAKCQQAELLFSMFVAEPPHSESSANCILMDGLLGHLKKLHNRELLLSAAESQRFTEMLLARPREDGESDGKCCWRPPADAPLPSARWRCFVKGISVTHVLVTLVPAAETDARALNSLRADGADGAGVRGVLPIYAYDCSLALLIDALIEKQRRPRFRDLHRDHTYGPQEQFPHEELLQLKGSRAAASPESRSEDSSDHIASDQRSLAEHCKVVSLAHCQAFVVAAYRSLLMQHHLGYEDMEAAVEQCEECLIEINVTEYLRAVCRHLGSGQESDSCEDMRYMHALVEAKFTRIMGVAFRQVPVHPDFYFCLPSSCQAGSDQPDYDDDDDDSFSGSDDDNNGEEVRFAFAEAKSQDLEHERPLFLQLNCSLHSKSSFCSAAVKLLPTCFGEIARKLDVDMDELTGGGGSLKITLDIICLSLPREVLEVSVEHTPVGLRTTSYCSEGSYARCSYEGNGNSLERLQSFDGADPMLHAESMANLPSYQYAAVSHLVEEIQWLLRDETAAVLLDKQDLLPSEQSLSFVAQHVADSRKRSSCYLDKVPLQFVFSSESSLPLFVEELEKLTVQDRYRVRQEGDLFYFVKQQQSKVDNDICQVGSISSSSGSEDEDEWLIELDRRRSELPNFWLILRVEGGSHVNVYFHCRFLELISPEVERYKQAQKSAVAQIKVICTKVNQLLLLRDLHDKRNCDPLLEPESLEDNDRSPAWNESNGQPHRQQQQQPGAPLPGTFRCPIIWEVPFCLHPRLKTGPGKTGLSRGIKALQAVLNRFSVNNRANMFVYQESNGSVFYLRLHERTSSSSNDDRGLLLQQAGDKLLSESDERLSMVSRSSSITSLSQAKSLLSMEAPLCWAADSRPRVRSFGERESDVLGGRSDSIVLVVHGISEAGPEVKRELAQVLQNRLDDAVLEVLSVMLERNPMCKLTPADVHFVQRPYKTPENVVRLSVQRRFVRHLTALGFYLRQNVLQFLYTPKYTDTRAHSHFQDYSQQDTNSSRRAAECDVFLYNQSHSSGSRGIACIAIALVDEKGELLNVSESSNDFGSMFRGGGGLEIRDFERVVSTVVYWGQNCEKYESLARAAYIEFRIWKQGRVNLEALVHKLKAAVRHANWDLITEYNFLPTPLTEPVSDVDVAATSVGELNIGYELGLEGKLRKVYHTTLGYWFQFALDLQVPAVKKHVVKLERRHSLPVVLKELESLIHNHAVDTTARTFVQWSRQPFVDACLTQDELLLSKNLDNSSEGLNSSSRWLLKASEYENLNERTFLPSDVEAKEDEHRGVYVKSIVIARNFSQWKASCSSTLTESEQLIPKDQKLLQRFNPLILDKTFIPRQRFLIAKVQSEHIILYTYNWSKERSEKLVKQVQNLGLWLSSRSSLYSNIVMQKLGIFCHQPAQSYEQQEEQQSSNSSKSQYYQIADMESLAKFPSAGYTDGKEWQRAGSSSVQTKANFALSWNQLMGQVMRDAKPSGQYPPNTTDPVIKAAHDFQELRHRDKRIKDDLSKLLTMWQSRGAATNIPITLATLNTFKQHSRLIHYCHTPLLFLPSWRLQSAATRDHSLAPPPYHTTANPQQRSRSTSDASNKRMISEWHKEICELMIAEYKQYLQVLGFSPLQIESNQKADSDASLTCAFHLKKLMLGGILLFEIHLSEPFFVVRLRVIESSRLQARNNSALANQFMLSFLDTCDKIKINMHLHSFTYDFHLRCIHSYIAGDSLWSLKHGYHLTKFLDDFNKYYSKAPNYARNLIYSGVVTVCNLVTPASTLYQYLLSHEKSYGMQVFSMADEDDEDGNTNDSQSCSEYVLVKLQSTPLVSYHDDQDTKYTNDFDVALIVTWLEQFEDAATRLDSQRRDISLKYYLMLTSKRELYPKHEVENDNKIGKFRTVYSVAKPQAASSSDESPKPEDEEEDTAAADRRENTAPTNDELASKAPTPPPVPDSPLAAITSSSLYSANLQQQQQQIRQESVNYLGYYSSHEQLMQQLIMSQASAAQQHIRSMVERGSQHCRTHLLWNQLLESKSSMSYVEFMELRTLTYVEPLSRLDPRLSPLLNQPVSWYQALAKLLQNKYQEYHKQFNAADGNVTHHLILHPNYVQAFMMLTIDLHTSRGELFAVYRKSEEMASTPFTIGDVYSLIEDFVNACCFHLWVGLYS